MALPIPSLTPGLVAGGCEYVHTPRFGGSEAKYYQTIKLVAFNYAIPWDHRNEYEFDHLIPRCLGGADDPANLWPQPIVEALRKDVHERSICHAVCTRHTLSLEQGRAFFLTNQWK